MGFDAAGIGARCREAGMGRLRSFAGMLACLAMALALVLMGGCSGGTGSGAASSGASAASAEEAVAAAIDGKLEAFVQLDPETLQQALAAVPEDELAAFGGDATSWLAVQFDGFDYTVDNLSIEGASARADITITCRDGAAFDLLLEERLGHLAVEQADQESGTGTDPDSGADAITDSSAGATVDATADSATDADAAQELVNDAALQALAETPLVKHDPLTVELQQAPDGSWSFTSESETALIEALQL